MLTLTHTDKAFSSLQHLFKEDVANLFNSIDVSGDPLSLPACDNAFDAGMDPNRTYVIKGGMLSCRYQGKHLVTWDEGDMVLPDAGGNTDQITCYAESAVLLMGYDTLELVDALLASKDGMRQWLKLVMVQQALLMRLLAAQTAPETVATPGFVYFHPNDVIIQQGEKADAVFSLFEGEAEVLADDVVVGHLKEGQILGAMAVLTNSTRSATVRAKTRCSVVKVPRDQFQTLIRSNPGMIHRLLTDMASQIQEMNAKVVQLSGEQKTS